MLLGLGRKTDAFAARHGSGLDRVPMAWIH